MIEVSDTPKALRARELGVYRGIFYYHPLRPDRDWRLKCLIEETLREHPSYGSRRIALHLAMNRKPIKRVMNLFGIKAYRRRGRKWKKTKNIKVIYPNLLLTEYPSYENHIWYQTSPAYRFKERKCTWPRSWIYSPGRSLACRYIPHMPCN